MQFDVGNEPLDNLANATAYCDKSLVKHTSPSTTAIFLALVFLEVLTTGKLVKGNTANRFEYHLQFQPCQRNGLSLFGFYLCQYLQHIYLLL